MSKFMDVLMMARTVLKSIPGIQSCQIGLEANLSADDYPLIRIVPQRLLAQDNGPFRRKMEVVIYFGAPLSEVGDGLEAVYAKLLSLEEEIKARITRNLSKTAKEAGLPLKAEHIDTLADDDRLPHYKLFALRVQIEAGDLQV